MFYVIELQTTGNTGASIVTTKETQEEALELFYNTMASASRSAVPQHGAMIVAGDMFILKNELAYRRPAQPEE